MEDFKRIVQDKILPSMTWLLIAAALTIAVYILVTNDIPGTHLDERLVNLIMAVLSGLLSLFFGSWRLRCRFGRKCKHIAVFMNMQRKNGERANLLHAQGRRNEAKILLEQSRANCERQINDLSEYNSKLNIYDQQDKIASLEIREASDFRIFPNLRKQLIRRRIRKRKLELQNAISTREVLK